MNVTVTGASGFVGNNLIPYLKSKDISVFSLSLRKKNWIEALTHSDSQAIIHLAGKAHDTSNTTIAEDYFKINTELTKELFHIFLSSNINDFFYFSSVKACADTVNGILDENHLPTPKTPYGKSKLRAEEYLLSHKIPKDKRVFIIRPCMIHGPNNKGNLNLLYKVIKKGIPWPLASFQNKRSFLSIDNLNFLIHKMVINKEIKSGIYNFSDDYPISTNELISIISSCTGKKEVLLKIPPYIIIKLAKLGDIIKLPLNSEKLKKLTESYVVSNTKIKNAIGLSELPTDPKQGLRKTIKSFEK